MCEWILLLVWHVFKFSFKWHISGIFFNSSFINNSNSLCSLLNLLFFTTFSLCLGLSLWSFRCLLSLYRHNVILTFNRYESYSGWRIPTFSFLIPDQKCCKLFVVSILLIFDGYNLLDQFLESLQVLLNFFLILNKLINILLHQFHVSVILILINMNSASV